MRLVTFFTPSHEGMMNEFVMPYAADFDESVIRRERQKCAAGAFKQEGWNDCMNDKLKTLIDLPLDGQPTLYVDSDVALSPRTARWARDAKIGDGEVAFSDDVVQWCAGVMLFRPSERTRDWWRLVQQLSNVWNAPDQDVIHSLRIQAQERSGALPVSPSVIPGDVVSNWSTIGNRTVWDGEDFEVPESCVAWHANWTIGVDRKVEMLRLAKAKMKR